MLKPREGLVADVEVEDVRMHVALLKVMVCSPTGQCFSGDPEFRISKSKSNQGQQFQQLVSDLTAQRLAV